MNVGVRRSGTQIMCGPGGRPIPGSDEVQTLEDVADGEFSDVAGQRGMF